MIVGKERGVAASTSSNANDENEDNLDNELIMRIFPAVSEEQLRRKYTPRNTLCILTKPGVLNDDSGPYWNNSPESMPYLDHHPSD